MTVADLIEKLQQLDPALPVLVRKGSNDYDHSAPVVAVEDMWRHPEAPNWFDTWDWDVRDDGSPFGSPPKAAEKVQAVVLD